MPPSYVLDTQTDSLKYLTCSICVTTDVYMCTYCVYLVLATICEVSQWAKRQQQAPHPLVTTVIYRSPKLLPFKQPDHQPLDNFNNCI